MGEALEARTETATPQRRLEARRAGHVARSQDLTAALLLLTASAAAWLAAEPLLDRTAWLLDDALGVADGAVAAHAARHVAGALAAVLPVLAVIWCAAYAAQVAQVGWVCSGRPLRPSWTRIDPRRGLGRLLDRATLVRFALDVAKVAAVIAVTAVTLRQRASVLVALPYLEVRPAVAEIGALMLVLAVRAGLALLLLGLLDLLFQRWKRERDLMMTREQVREELRQTEGDPVARHRRRRRHAELRDGVTSLRTAHLVIAGDEVAVALEYGDDAMQTPRVVAKGVADAARRLREMAAIHRVPILEHAALARSLHTATRPGATVPSGLYPELARLIARSLPPAAESRQPTHP